MLLADLTGSLFRSMLRFCALIPKVKDSDTETARMILRLMFVI